MTPEQKQYLQNTLDAIKANGPTRPTFDMDNWVIAYPEFDENKEETFCKTNACLAGYMLFANDKLEYINQVKSCFKGSTRIINDYLSLGIKDLSSDDYYSISEALSTVFHRTFLTKDEVIKILETWISKEKVSNSFEIISPKVPDA